MVSSRLRIINFPEKISKKYLREIFSKYGRVTDIYFVKKKK